MSKIYVSYTMRDDKFAQELMTSLRAAGHEITIEGARLTPGINWRLELNQGLKAAEVFIILISESTMHSQFPMMELGTARAYAETSGKMLILPIVLGELALPTIVQDIQVIFARNRPATDLVADVDVAISAFEGRRAAQEEQQEELAQAVQGNLAEFVDEAIKTQQQYEKAHKVAAQRWYLIGYASLVFGLLTTAYLAYSVIISTATTPDYARTISISLLNVIAIAILAALARYAYSLGKSYMSESLKSSDRIHAIQFGKFFLRAYGSQTNSAEIREVFQYWNIDRTSTFSSLDASQIDPQIVNMVVQIVSAITGKKDK
ncbi:toll/interleukin-1 receptor domain-containing protein [Agrobacterium vitis]|uniref:TIR domain-containing protein n=2 Tax=Agrobacterium vitis TaxID=373 RepID=A0AAE5AUG6_AGRVI|nr:toll/interleukin-1 receptor domain-containing protein [Agrobacterium vitis]MCF1497817.1 toll/interleukin-1 receptor domain-containing protein [Allorhizobium sp. Av2]MCM2438717.1 toll/interleukin-1 receptor domain-containing protein [Agrobacterium vitis]MUZ55957.1 TIR domain-containing protein [Agrobacterium vitis]